MENHVVTIWGDTNNQKPKIERFGLFSDFLFGSVCFEIYETEPNRTERNEVYRYPKP